MRQVGVITLFPQMFCALESFGVTAKALQDGLISLRYFNPRDYTTDKHHTVDDKPYGGGPGMILKVEPLVAAIREPRMKTLVLIPTYNEKENIPVLVADLMTIPDVHVMVLDDQSHGAPILAAERINALLRDHIAAVR